MEPVVQKHIMSDFQHLTPEQREIFFTHLSKIDPTWPYITWMDWARLLAPNPYDSLDDPKRQLIPEVILATLVTSPALALAAGATKSQRLVELISDAKIAQGTELFDAPIYSRWSATSVVPTRSPKTTLSVPDAIELASETFEYPHSALAVARELIKGKVGITIDDTKTRVAQPRKAPAPTAEPLLVSQLAFLRSLGAAAAKFADLDAIDLTLRTYFGVTQSARGNAMLAEPFLIDKPELMDDARAEWQLEQTRRSLARLRIRDIVRNFVDLGLMRRICHELNIWIPTRSSTATPRRPAELLASLKLAERQAVQQRFDTLVKITEAQHYNGCPHTRLTPRSIIERHAERFLPDALLGPEPSSALLQGTAPIACRACGLELMCPHSFVMNSPARGKTPLSYYLRQQGRHTLCKLCGEIVVDDLLADFDFVAVQDPQCRRVAYARYMLCKAYIKGNPPASVIDFIYPALFAQFSNIEALRGISSEQREAFQRVYADIHLLVAFGLLGYKLMEGRGSQPSSPVEALIGVVQTLNGRTLDALAVDRVRLIAIVSNAAKVLKQQLTNVQGAVSLNTDVGAVNNIVLMQYALVGSIFTIVGAQGIVPDGSDAKGAALNGTRLEAEGFAVADYVRRVAARAPPSIKNMAQRWLAEVEWNSPAPPEVVATQDSYSANRRFVRWGFISFDHVTRAPGSLSLHFFRGVLGALGKVTEQQQWDEITAAGVAPQFTAVDKEAQEAAAAVAHRVTRQLFIEAYSALCPATNLSHEWHGGPPPKCATCGATLEEIYKDDAYFRRYEKAFTNVVYKHVKDTSVEPQAPGPATGVAHPVDPQALTLATQRLASRLSIDACYLFSLGDLIGRTYEQTRTEAYAPRYSNVRYSLLCSYYQRLHSLLAYYENYDRGVEFKLEPIIEFRKAQQAPALGPKKGGSEVLSTIATHLVEFSAVTPRMEPETAKAAIEALLVAFCDDLFAACSGADKALGELAARDILRLDRLTAKLDKREMVVDSAGSIEEQLMAPDSLEREMRRETYAHDAFYQDFLFEGDEEQLAPRDPVSWPARN